MGLVSTILDYRNSTLPDILFLNVCKVLRLSNTFITSRKYLSLLVLLWHKIDIKFFIWHLNFNKSGENEKITKYIIKTGPLEKYSFN